MIFLNSNSKAVDKSVRPFGNLNKEVMNTICRSVKTVRTLPFIQTSVFTDDRYSFSGNQLATFWKSDANQSLTNEEMLGITREMNFSESTFVFEPKLKSCVAKVRIFTPGSEIPFAGHPTLGTAFALRKKKIIADADDHFNLELGIGKTPVAFLTKREMRMNQSEARVIEELDDVSQVLKAIGLTSRAVSEDYPAQVLSTGFPFLILPLTKLSAVKRATPKPSEILKALEGHSSREVVIFSTETEHSDSSVHARMFAPGAGVMEDPATGSAAGPLGAYVENQGLLPTQTKGDFVVIEQGYEINRPSRLVYQSATLRGKNVIYVSGSVKLMAEGNFFLK
ncbi:MAG: PhzF family phenazine biosynthesis protein [Candidatus Thorarchaeota archaeon]|nr:PhzF family phenazine biosynthesis protein [Candidatus Thorarchaeota archaeon]